MNETRRFVSLRIALACAALIWIAAGQPERLHEGGRVVSSASVQTLVTENPCSGTTRGSQPVQVAIAPSGCGQAAARATASHAERAAAIPSRHVAALVEDVGPRGPPPAP
ncbi:MAG TPA: hypothetical protein VFY93_19310 [Planctomycetota bacterium]|nr:hypothetical protein [Planctomycetota bacterium]